ncbi:hypothetical protein BDW74DRAFT_187959 [Aspergillus multicolor]|uniref:uncharacterized protein n=1 Tax=Aspergillus multicolor TaxID=41759 RepID=UPI003CCCAF52
MSEPSKQHADYTIAWICALPLEAAAARTMLDKTHPQLPQSPTDHNIYTLGEISGHNILIVCLPSGIYGTVSAAIVLSQVLSTYTALNFGLMVGVGGGIPRTVGNNMWLGDIVVSKPTSDGTSGVVAYDSGKLLGDGKFALTTVMNRPPQLLLNTLSHLQTEVMMGKSLGISAIVARTLDTHPEMAGQFSMPDRATDRLFQADYNHPRGATDCSGCEQQYLVIRPTRASDEPRVHYGVIASGNQLIRDSVRRDHLADKYGALCFEMEAAGLMNQVSFLVIRGISDYCDSHKSKRWQGYAALTAAAYAKILLSKIPPAYGSTSATPAAINPASESPKPFFMVPFAQNSQFLGRDQELLLLKRMIIDGTGPRKVAISGLGGIGKTQVAINIAYHFRNQGLYSVFWISSASAQAVQQGFFDLAARVGLRDITPDNVNMRVKSYLASDATRPWILIIDNADDMEIWSPSFVRETLPVAQHGFTLFTTRNHQLAVRLAGRNIVRVMAMDSLLAMAMLRQTLWDESLMGNDEDAFLFVDHLQGLPLAIIQAANYMNENQDFGDEWRYAEIKNPITMTWLVSFQQIQKLNELSIEYLFFMSCLSFARIPLLLLPPADSSVKKQSALGILKAYHLIAENTEDETQFFTLHRLVLLATRNWLRGHEDLDAWVEKAVRQLSAVMPMGFSNVRDIERSYLPHAQRLLEYESVPSKTLDREQLAWKVAICLHDEGRYRESESLIREVFEAREARLGFDNYDTLHSLSWLAHSMFCQRKWKCAEKLTLKALEWAQKTTGLDDSFLHNLYLTLANIYQSQGIFADAQTIMKDVITRSEQAFGEKNDETLASMESLAHVYAAEGKYTQAEQILTVVLQTLGTVDRPSNARIARAKGHMASIFEHQHRWNEAETLRGQQIVALEAAFNPHHPDIFQAQSQLARLWARQGRLSEAEEMLTGLCDQSQTVLGSQDPTTMDISADLARLYLVQKRFAEAEVLLENILHYHHSVQGESDQETLQTMDWLADAKEAQNKLDEADSLRTRLVQISRSKLGPDNLRALVRMNDLAVLYLRQGRDEEAECLQIEVLDAERRLLPEGDRRVVGGMWNLALIRRKMGKFAQCIEVLEECLNLRSNTLGPAHPETLAAEKELEYVRIEMEMKGGTAQTVQDNSSVEVHEMEIE